MRWIAVSAISLMLLASGEARSAETPKGGVALSSVKTEKPKRTFESWLKDLKKRVARTRARPNQLVAVAAIRGEEKDIAPKLYWKGRRAEGAVSAAELTDFEKGIDAALAGDPEAKTRLQEFVASYPKSSLGPDAHMALDRLAAAEVKP